MLVNNSDDPDSTESAYLAKILDMFDNGMATVFFWQLIIRINDAVTKRFYFVSTDANSYA